MVAILFRPLCLHQLQAAIGSSRHKSSMLSYWMKTDQNIITRESQIPYYVGIQRLKIN